MFLVQSDLRLRCTSARNSGLLCQRLGLPSRKQTQEAQKALNEFAAASIAEAVNNASTSCWDKAWGALESESQRIPTVSPPSSGQTFRAGSTAIQWPPCMGMRSM